MKKFLILAAAVLFLGLVSCETTSYITLSITNPDGNPVSFRLVSFTSSIDTLSEISDYANKIYQIEVNPNGDKVRATIWKTSIDDIELAGQLDFEGTMRDFNNTQNIVIPVYVECDIP